MTKEDNSMRPRSIVWFERLYIAAIVLGIVATIQSWSIQAAMLDSDPRLAKLTWLPHASLVLRVAIALGLWHLIMRRHNVVAKWVVAVFAVYGAGLLLVLAYGVARGATPIAVGIPSALQNILYIAAAAMLFRPDARPWFGASDAA